VIKNHGFRAKSDDFGGVRADVHHRAKEGYSTLPLTASVSSIASPLLLECVTYLWRELRLLVLLSLSAQNKGQKGPLKKQMCRERECGRRLSPSRQIDGIVH
jgi:hypothetical protein